MTTIRVKETSLATIRIKQAGPQGIQGIEGPIGDFTLAGTWTATAYGLHTIVEHLGSSWYANDATLGSDVPSVSPKWVLLAEKGEQGIQGGQGLKGDKGDQGDPADSSLLPTVNQKAALDASNTPSALNQYVTLDDLDSFSGGYNIVPPETVLSKTLEIDGSLAWNKVVVVAGDVGIGYSPLISLTLDFSSFDIMDEVSIVEQGFDPCLIDLGSEPYFERLTAIPVDTIADIPYQVYGVYTTLDTHVYLYMSTSTFITLYKKDTGSWAVRACNNFDLLALLTEGAYTVTADQKAALDGATTADGTNYFTTINDLPIVITDHTALTNIGTNSHDAIDTALSRLANTDGTNTGDQNLSGYSPTSHLHTGTYQPAGTYSTDIHSNITALNAVTNTNTGDETQSTIQTKLGAASDLVGGYVTAIAQSFAGLKTFIGGLIAKASGTLTEIALDAQDSGGTSKFSVLADGTINFTGYAETITSKAQHIATLKQNGTDFLLRRQTTYWNGSSFVATEGYGFGRGALQNNTGATSNGFGYVALQNNTGAYSNGFGYAALLSNTGQNSNGFGLYALQNNTGTSSNGFGHAALQNNTGQNSNGFGYYALQNNTGTNSNGFGYLALQNNTGTSCNGFGHAALLNNTGVSSNGFGHAALQYNTGASSNGFGYRALLYNQGNQNTVIGNDSYGSTFLDNTAGNKTSAFSAVDITLDRITFITAHGFGANNAYVNIKYASTTGTAIGGLTVASIYQVKIIDANTIEFRAAGRGTDLTSQGTLDHVFTPQFSYSNITALGYGALATKSNQVVIGNASVVETLLRGVVTTASGIGNEVALDVQDSGGTSRFKVLASGTTTVNGSLYPNALGHRTGGEFSFQPYGGADSTTSTASLNAFSINGVYPVSNRRTGGVQIGFDVGILYNQASGDASNIDLRINRKIYANGSVGSGTQRLVSLGVTQHPSGGTGGTFVEKAYISPEGALSAKALILNTRPVNSSGALAVDDHTLRVTTGVSNIAVNLSAAVVGQIVVVKKIDDGTGVVSFVSGTSCTIDGLTTRTISQQYESLTLQCTQSGAICSFDII